MIGIPRRQGQRDSYSGTLGGSYDPAKSGSSVWIVRKLLFGSCLRCVGRNGLPAATTVYALG